jgi:hypothetical protein
MYNKDVPPTTSDLGVVRRTPSTRAEAVVVRWVRVWDMRSTLNTSRLYLPLFLATATLRVLSTMQVAAELTGRPSKRYVDTLRWPGVEKRGEKRRGEIEEGAE